MRFLSVFHLSKDGAKLQTFPEVAKNISSVSFFVVSLQSEIVIG